MESNGCYKSFCVLHKGAVLLLIWTALLHSVFYYSTLGFVVSLSILENGHYTEELLGAFVVISIARAITYLLYPVTGLLAELYCSRYKVMIVGNVIAVVGGAIAVPGVLLLLITWFSAWGITVLKIATIGVILHQFGLGLFEANAIQFGVDQLQFASNDDVSKFVNWYFWAITFLQIPGCIYFGVFITIASLLFMCCRCHRFLTEPVRRVNPVKHIVKVLQYAKHHTAPVFRSAFTYGEGPPSRLDLAKDRYGGPYTTEEVEDVKNFGRILLLLSSQFGILLVGGVSLFDASSYYLYSNTGWALLSLVTGGKVAWALVLLVTIPIYMVVIRPHFQQYVHNMIKRMGISLVLAIISLSLLIPVNNETIFLGILAQITGALAYLLNFLTALEFIIAQAPHNMQGLLIGIWYAYQAVAVLVQLVTIVSIDNNRFNYLLAVIKLPIAVLSFILHVIVSRWYIQNVTKRN